MEVRGCRTDRAQRAFFTGGGMRSIHGHRLPRLVAPLLGSVLLPTLLAAGPAGVNRWSTAGPRGGRPMAIVVDPSQSPLVFAGAYAGGLFKSTNGGARWKVQVKGLNNETVQALAIDAAVPATLYAGTLK